MLFLRRFCSLLFFFFVIITFNFINLFSGLLPENIIFVGRDKYSQVKSIKPGDLAVSLDERFGQYDFCRSHVSDVKLSKNFSNKAILITLKSENGTSGFVIVGENQKFYDINAVDKLNPKLLCRIKNNQRKLLKVLSQTVWIDAKGLNVSDQIKGYQNTKLTVTNIEHVKFKKKLDFYEISLKRLHLFYLIDSGGNRILTHNAFSSSALIVIGLSTLVGAIFGSSIVAYKSHKNDVLSAKTVAKGALMGAAIGGVTSAAVFYGIIAYIKYVPLILNKVNIFLENFSSIKLLINVIKTNPNAFILIGSSTATYLTIKIDDFVNEIVRKKTENVDFSGVDFIEENRIENRERLHFGNNNIELIQEEILFDENGELIRDEDGRIARLFIGRYRNA